jgi:ElaB/YqjD/DUF883 family membrane-anchored ribosome-binding protein
MISNGRPFVCAATAEGWDVFYLPCEATIMSLFSRARSDSERGDGIHVAALTQTAAEVSTEAGRRLADVGEAATRRFADARDMIETLVKNQPVLALGAALAAGVVIGWLIKRR